MRIEKRTRDGIFEGRITVMFRRWKRPQVLAGRAYRTVSGLVAVDAIEPVGSEASISDADARAAGYPDGAAILADLRGDASSAIYRLTVRPAEMEDPRAVLARNAALDADAVAGIDERLQRLDRAAERSGRPAWTAETLQIIAAHPAVRAADLAESLGRERDPFKLDVRKLKNLGLTLSLEIGYRLSPRGEAYLAARSVRDQGAPTGPSGSTSAR